MVLKDLRKLPQFGSEFMGKVYKAKLVNDTTQKIAFLSKLPGNLGDMIMKDLDDQKKTLDQIY